MTASQQDAVVTRACPDLTFAVTAAEAEPFAAVPTLRFTLEVVREGGGPVRGMALTTTVRIDVTRRAYAPDAHRALTELFGLPEEWSRTMGPLQWARTTVQVPPFDDRTSVPLFVQCGTETELAVTKYLRAVKDGEVPLGFLFNGMIFYEASGPPPGGMLRTAPVPSSAEAFCRLPAGLWHELIARYHGTTPWLRLPQEIYDRLDHYRARHTLGSAGDAVRALLDRSGAL